MAKKYALTNSARTILTSFLLTPYYLLLYSFLPRNYRRVEQSVGQHLQPQVVGTTRTVDGHELLRLELRWRERQSHMPHRAA